MDPRLYGIPATRASVVAIIRRGPSGWSHLGRWDPSRGTYEPGSWLGGHLYPQRCDLSPDGRWFCYFAMKANARWPAGQAYVAVSRLPWLRSLAVWGMGSTWTRGAHFVESRREWEVGDPDEGDPRPLRRRYGLRWTRPASFGVERRRGWTESADTPPRTDDDFWETRRVEGVVMEKQRPGTRDGIMLTVRGRYAAFREGPPAWDQVSYRLVEATSERIVPDAQWADWDASGGLLVATRSGHLRVYRDLERLGEPESDIDLAGLSPDPVAPPDEAGRW